MKHFTSTGKNRALVTGSAGFIGSHLVDKLLASGYSVVGIDNFSLGTLSNIEHLSGQSNFTQIDIDLVDSSKLKDFFSNYNFDVIFHFAANSDVRLGSRDTSIDLKSNFYTTKNILENMVENQISKIVFASTSAIYGDLDGEISEDQGPLFPTSFYGASKLASEAFISTYSNLFDIQSWLFRFPNVVGPRLTHGVIFDFISKLKSNSSELEILGDGKQKKPYLHVSDLLNAISMVYEKSQNMVNFFNVGPRNTTSVEDIADFLIEVMSLSDVNLFFTGGKIGWPGDIAKFSYNTSKIRKMGWSPSYSSNEAVKKAIRENLND